MAMTVGHASRLPTRTDDTSLLARHSGTNSSTAAATQMMSAAPCDAGKLLVVPGGSRLADEPVLAPPTASRLSTVPNCTSCANSP